jgi:hypothetical protein
LFKSFQFFNLLFALQLLFLRFFEVKAAVVQRLEKVLFAAGFPLEDPYLAFLFHRLNALLEPLDENFEGQTWHRPDFVGDHDALRQVGAFLVHFVDDRQGYAAQVLDLVGLV